VGDVCEVVVFLYLGMFCVFFGFLQQFL